MMSKNRSPWAWTGLAVYRTCSQVERLWDYELELHWVDKHMSILATSDFTNKNKPGPFIIELNIHTYCPEVRDTEGRYRGKESSFRPNHYFMSAIWVGISARMCVHAHTQIHTPKWLLLPFHPPASMRKSVSQLTLKDTYKKMEFWEMQASLAKTAHYKAITLCTLKDSKPWWVLE